MTGPREDDLKKKEELSYLKTRLEKIEYTVQNLEKEKKEFETRLTDIKSQEPKKKEVKGNYSESKEKIIGNLKTSNLLEDYYYIRFVYTYLSSFFFNLKKDLNLLFNKS